MSESPAKVRLVRCPKCENLLPEVTDYSVYQCGGCGAVLCAENKRIDSGMSSEKSGDESDAILNKVSKESVNLDLSSRSVNNMSLVSENGVKSNGSSGRRPGKDISNNMEFEEPKPVFGNNKSVSRRSVRASNWRYHEAGLQEGSSSYHYAAPPPPRHEYAELVQDTNGVEVDDDRAELLRKLDELKYEIVRSRDKSQEKVPMHHHHNAPSYMHHTSHSLMANSNQVQVFSDPFRSQNHRRNPILPFEQQQYHPYYSGPYVSNEMTDNRLFHHPSCSCSVCYNKHQQAPPPPPPQPPPPPIALAPPVLQNDPPFIEEFNYPMPEKCADGNTNVFVNGRELHQKDLDLLVRRGLPADADRSYVIEISGRVLDEDSGLELEGLGKLAPTGTVVSVHGGEETCETGGAQEAWIWDEASKND
ncbi:hypothetical protein M8C21_032543 [Ambrosia artemisiifolia]|uniref:Enhanced disease resistance 4-like N-terminal domain-containing protein n=1 Tax=Ambrosia artemisiifolia TaxID=4212 RepID=A0AAD5CWI3_AMBAR|nr:hypothetical protein M8C21_032543 [Ambrosia artemisiifolia]